MYFKYFIRKERLFFGMVRKLKLNESFSYNKRICDYVSNVLFNVDVGPFQSSVFEIFLDVLDSRKVTYEVNDKQTEIYFPDRDGVIRINALSDSLSIVYRDENNIPYDYSIMIKYEPSSGTFIIKCSGEDGVSIMSDFNDLRLYIRDIILL